LLQVFQFHRVKPNVNKEWACRSLGVLALLAALMIPLAHSAETTRSGVWSFRNGFCGIFPCTQPPLRWSTDENVLWHAALDGRSNASPIIVGDRVFILSEPYTLLCLNKADGRVLWSRSHALSDLLGEAAMKRPPLPRTNWLNTYGYTTPTPVSDGKLIWCVFGHGVVVCYDLSGTRQWFAEIDVADKISGVAVSPCQIDDVLIVGGKGADRLCGFDAYTGRKLWNTDEGTQEGSCVPITLNGRHYVVASAGLLIDPRSGSILQRNLLGAGLNGDAAKIPVNWGPTVVVNCDTAFFHAHFQPDQYNTVLRAVRLDAMNPPQQLWEFYPSRHGDIRERMGNSPLLFNGLLYAIQDGGMLQVFDASNGRLHYEQKLPKHSYASLTLAGPYIYAFGGNIVTVLKPGESYQQVAQFKHGFRDFIASPVFEDRRLYFRDVSGLWCIEEPLPAASSAVSAAPSPPVAQPPADDGPDLADTAKTAPLLSYSEWLLEYDQTRLPLRRFSLIFEWTFAAIALALGIAALRRAAERPGRFVIATFAATLAALFPLLMITDRVGNAYYAVGIWCLAGAFVVWKIITQPASLRRSYGVANVRPPIPATKFSRALSLTWGWLLGGAAGLAIHHIPFQLVVMWYVLTRWQS
jgi:outer membrane protein assembly factor BamB